jgi:hypothetical protein
LPEVNLHLTYLRISFRFLSVVAKNFEVEENEVGGTCSTNGEKRNVYRLLVGKPEGKRPLVRTSRRRIDNIKMDLLEIGLHAVDWIGLAQDTYRWRALVNAVMNIRVQ